MDIPRIINAANNIVVLDASLDERLEAAHEQLFPLKGTSKPEVEERIGPILEQVAAARDSGDHDEMAEAAWAVVRYYFEAEAAGIK